MAFKDYKSTLFTPYILPVIPRDQPLAPTCKIEPERIGKIPGYLDKDGWHGFWNWQRNTAQDGMLNAWDRMYKPPLVPTVCIQTRAFTALDSDAEDAMAASIIDHVALKIFGPGPVRKRPGSEKFLRLYRFKGSVRIMKRKEMFRSPDGKLQSFEICGHGQQVLLEGRHPNGTLYYWLADQTPPVWGAENLTEIDNDQVNEFITEARGMLEAFGYDFSNARGPGSGQTTAGRSPIGPDHPDQCPDLALLVDWLAKCPCDAPQFADRDEWFKIVTAIKAACGGDEALFDDHVLPWAAVVEGNTEEYMRERWDSINDSALGWSYLLAVSQDIDPTVMLSMFTDLSGLLSDEDVGTPPTPIAAVVRPDERAIAEKFAEANAQKRWMIVEHRGRAVEWYRNDAGIWVRDGLSIGDDVSRQCARVSDVIRANPNATQQEQTLARSLQGDTVSKHVVNMVKNMPSMHTPIAKLDARRWLLGFKGGYVDEDNRLRDPDPSLYITKQLGVIPIFNAPAPMWDAHLASLCKNEEDEIEALLRWWGYNFSGTGQEQKFLFMWGTGGVGVTTTLEALGLIGGDYAGAVSHKAFMRGEGERFGVAALAGFWFIFTSEIDKACEWADATLVTATGSGTLSIEEKRMDPRNVEVRWGINFQGNQLPRFRRIDRAIRRRTMIAKFTGEKIADKMKVDKDYFRKMVAEEGPAIMGRILEARGRYQRHSLIIPTRWQNTADEYFNSLDKKLLWRTERLELDGEAVVTIQALYDDWCQWHRDTGHGQHAGTLQGFAQLHEDEWLREHGVRFDKKRVNTKHPVASALGIRLVCQVGASFGPIDEGKF